jgi:hypothetical protein
MKTVTVVGGNLFRLALEHLNDASQWNRIAQANGLIDPVLTGTMALRIPAVDANAGGGVFVPAR